MKIIKTILGNKTIADSAEQVLLMRIREILSEHRNALINRVLTNLPSYIEYTFDMKPPKEKLQLVIDRLQSIKDHPVDLDTYSAMVKQIMANQTTHLSLKPFYDEINETIKYECGAVDATAR
jgi:uncharacterized lipoprotein YmbA